MQSSTGLFRRGVYAIAVLTGTIAGVSPASAAALLGSAGSFTILAGSTVTNTDATTISGNIGVYPGSAITGSGTITIIGAEHQTDAVALRALSDSLNAFNNLVALAPTGTLTGQDLGSVGVLTPGVYTFAASAQLTGTLTLNFAGASNEAFVFQIDSALTTASGSSVVVENGTSTDSVYFEVGSSATLGTNTSFAGNILANQSITLGASATILCGRAIALNGAVTMDNNTISNDCSGGGDLGTGSSDFGSTGFIGVASTATTLGTPSTLQVPEPASVLFLLVGVAGIAGLRRRSVA